MKTLKYISTKIILKVEERSKPTNEHSQSQAHQAQFPTLL